jgi:hypothetical protein
MTELAYKYFFKTLSAQADRLMQSAEVSCKRKKEKNMDDAMCF